MGRSALILILSAMFTFSVIYQSVNQQLLNGLQSSIDYYTDTQLRNINFSSAQFIFTTLATTPTYRSTGITTRTVFGGIASYRVVDTSFNGENLIKAAISSSYNNKTRQITVYILKRPPVPGVLPSSVHAAITARANIATLGSLIIDGRDHDINGNLTTPAGGTYGIYTTGGITQGGSSTIGGYSGTTTYAPDKPANAGSIRSGQPTDSTAATPDEALGGTSAGYPEGTLKAIALSGAGGSQYTTDPNTLTYPLQGVTFVELPSGTIWTSTNLQGSGVLIVSNSAHNAQMVNLNTGTFTGLMIADDIVHLHTEVIGAIILLTPTPADGNCIGNGSGRAIYSSAAVKEATRAVMEAGNIGGTNIVNYGFRNSRLFLRFWYE